MSYFKFVLSKILLAYARKRNRFVRLVIFLVVHRQYYQVFQTDLGLSNSYIKIATKDRLFLLIKTFLFPGLMHVFTKLFQSIPHYSKVKFVYHHVKCMYTLYFSIQRNSLSSPSLSSLALLTVMRIGKAGS